METTRPQTSDTSFRELLSVLARQKWVIAITLAVAVALAVAAIFLTEPMYESSSLIVVEGRTQPNQTQYANANDPLRPLTATPSVDVPTQIQQIQSRFTLGTALQEVVSQDPKLNPERVEDVTVLARQLGVTNVIEVKVTSPNAVLSKALADAIPTTYDRQVTARNSQQFKQGVNFLQGQIQSGRQNLNQLEQELDKFRRENAISSSPTEASERSQAALRAEAEYTAAQATYEGAQRSLQIAEQSRRDLPETIPNPTVQNNIQQRESVRDEISRLQAERRALLQTYKPTAQEVRELDARINERSRFLKTVQTTIDDQRKVRNPLINEYDSKVADARRIAAQATAQRDEAKKYYDQTKQRVDEYNRLQAGLSRLGRDINQKQVEVANLTAQQTQLSLFLNQIRPPVQPIGAASEPMRSRPNPPLYFALALVVGSLLAAGLAFVKDRIEDRVATPDQALRLADAPLLGYAPAIGLRRRRGGKQLALPARPSESFRILRSNVLFGLREGEDKSLLVTATGADEGKTEVAQNLAAAIAATGKQVLLVDADLHNPSQHLAFGKTGAPGLADVLSGGVTSRDAIVATDHANLSLLPAGDVDKITTDGLSSERMEALNVEFGQAYDLVVYDTPPMMPRSDALAVSGFADAVVYVVKPGAATKASMGYSLELLRHGKARLLGIVLAGTNFFADER